MTRDQMLTIVTTLMFIAGAGQSSIQKCFEAAVEIEGVVKKELLKEAAEKYKKETE